MQSIPKEFFNKIHVQFACSIWLKKLTLMYIHCMFIILYKEKHKVFGTCSLAVLVVKSPGP